MEIKFDKEKIKAKASEIAGKVKKTANDGWNWAVENKENIAGMIPVALGLIGIWKTVKPTQSFGERERYRKDHEWWNPHTGHRWSLKRKPTNYEWAEISRRQRLDEPDEVILSDLGLI